MPRPMTTKYGQVCIHYTRQKKHGALDKKMPAPYDDDDDDDDDDDTDDTCIGTRTTYAGAHALAHVLRTGTCIGYDVRRTPYAVRIGTCMGTHTHTHVSTKKCHPRVPHTLCILTATASELIEDPSRQDSSR